MERTKYVWDPVVQEFIPEVAGSRETLQEILTRLYDRVRGITEIQAILCVSLLLRLYQLGKSAFWYDEGVSVVLARLPWNRMIQATAGDVHPPGYYVLLWLIARSGIPLSEWVARSPSLIFSLVAVYLTWKLVNHPEIKLSRIGKYIVIGWVIISPLQLHYAQEARMYSLLQIEVLLAILFVIDRRRAFLSVVLTAMLYTHNYAVFYLPTLAVVALVTDYRFIFNTKMSIIAIVKKWALCFVIPVLLWVPWFFVMLGQMGIVSGGYWIQPVKLSEIIFVLYQMLFAYSMPPTFQGLGVMLTCGVLIYTAWRIYRDRPHNWLMLFTLAFGPLVLSVFVSVVWKPILLFRGLIGTTIPLTILVVKAIEGISYQYKRIYAYSLIGVTLVAGLVGHYTYNAENKGTTTTWVQEIVDQMEHGDVIVALNDNGIIAMETYASDVPVFKLTSCDQEPFGSLSPQTRKAIGVEERSLDEILPINADYYKLYEILPPNASYYKTLHNYSRVYFISTVSPISPPCEIDMANEIISGDNIRLIHELANDEYAQAGVYLITTGDIY